jgi:opacity protein-like surface antigen
LRHVASLGSALIFTTFLSVSALAQTGPAPAAGQASPPPAPAQKNPPAPSGQVTTPNIEVFLEGGGSFMRSGAWTETIPVSICVPSTTMSCPAVSGPYTIANMTSSFSTAASLAGGARLRFSRHDAIDASYLFSFNHLTVHAAATNPTTKQPLVESGTSFTRLQLVSFNYARYFLVHSRVQPFVTAGMGSSHFKGPLSATAPTEGLIGGGDKFQFAWNFGGGADILLRHHLVLRLDVRDYVIGQPLPIRGSAQGIMPMAGLVYRFL